LLLLLLLLVTPLAFPCFHGGLLALPLCGAALTFFAAAKKVSKESGLTPPALRWLPQFGVGSGAPYIRVLAHSALVTRQSFFRRRFARRSGRSQNHRAFGRVAGRESSRGFCGSPPREPSLRFALFWLRRRVRQKRDCNAGIWIPARQSDRPAGASPRRSRWPPPRKNASERCKRTLPASTQCEAGNMTALSQAPNARGHGCLPRPYALRTGGPNYKLAV